MADFILGIDAGGTAVKAAAYSLDGRELGVTVRGLRPLTPAPGHAERDPRALWREVAAAIGGVLAEAKLTGADIAAVGVTGYGNGLYLVDAAGEPVAPGVLSSDTRAVPLVEAWRAEGLEPEELALTGKRFWPGSSLSLLAWFDRHRPEVLDRAAAALSCKDYLRLRLTGRVAAEITDQSTASLVPLEGRRRAPRVLALVGLERRAGLLPGLIEPYALAGAVTAGAAAETGLREGTPVSAGCCDNLAVMYGTGAVGFGEIVVMSGTWGLHQVILDHPPPAGIVAFVCHAAESGQWLLIEGSPSSAGSFEWFAETFLRRPGQAEPAALAYETSRAALAETRPEDPPVFFLPFLNGAIDDLHARGSLVGFSTWHRLGHAVRAVYEGVAFEHRRHLDTLLRACARPAGARFAGGPARSAEWSKIFAAALGLKLEVPQGVEFGARGAAALAAVASGRFADIRGAVGAMTALSHVVEPEPGLRGLLDRRFADYCRLHAALRPFWHDAAASLLTPGGSGR
ncbi:MAG TPA: FGGY-family carbohydrate kinase [Dongiaceae bacterium]|nr:FGGY-family carbohydrate kinase [Dongiaceae bacterium]